MSTRKILFVGRKSTKKTTCYSHGSFGLFNSAAFVVNKLNELGYEAKLDVVDDANGIDRVVYRYNPQLVVVEALWVPPLKFAQLLPLHFKRRWLVRVHSKAPFLAMESVAFDWMRDYANIGEIYPNLKLSCNNHQFNDEINLIKGWDSLYLPNIYYPPYLNNEEKRRWKTDEDIINIGCFGAIRPLKNQLLQGIAAIIFAESLGKQLYFHINSTRPEQHGEGVLRNLRALFTGTPHKLIEHDWYTHEEFATVLIPQMDMGMQVSLTESFNIVTADFVNAGVPILVSDDVDWMPRGTRVSPNSAEVIAAKLHILWRMRSHSGMRRNKLALKKYNDHAVERWESYLNE